MLPLKKNTILVALVVVQLLLTTDCRSLGNGVENGNGSSSSGGGVGVGRRNGRWQSIEIVGECGNQTLFEQCYGCGRDTDSTEIYSSCCIRVPEIVEICSGNFSDE